jgi:hypothetical protein
MRTLRQQITVAAALLLLSPVIAHGQTLTVVWDPNPTGDQVTSYEVCIGTASLTCDFRQASVPATETSYAFAPNAGVLYFVAVRAISAAGAGNYSSEVSASIPLLNQPANQTSPLNALIAPLSLSAIDPDGDSLQFSHSGLPLGLVLNPATGIITGIPVALGTFNVTIFVADGLVTTSQTFTWSIVAGNSSDTTPPSLSITSHTSGQTVTTASITLAGTVTDSGSGDNGVTGVAVNGAAATGGTATGSATANWSRSVALANGANTLTVIATDGAGNSRSTQITITRGTPDTTAPSLAITSHTTGQTVNTSSIVLAGTASDNGRGNSGITSVTVNGSAATGGTATGSGTANWNRSVALSTGANTLTVVATDGAGNQRTSSISVTYAVPSMTGASLSQSLASPQTVGTAITFTASGSGGVGPYEYQWYAQRDGGSTSMLRSWNSSTTYAWTPTQAGNYLISIWARSAGVTANAAQATAQRTFVITAPNTSGTGDVARDTFTGSSGMSLTAHVPDVSSGLWVQRQGATAQLQSGRVAEVASSVGYGLATLESGAADGTVVVDLTSTGSTPFGGIVFRAVDTNRLLLLRYIGNASIGLLGLFRRVNGSFELIDQITIAPVAYGSTHRLGAQLNGSQVQAIWDGAVVLTRTVTDYQTATQHGLLWHSDDPSAQFDNFLVTAGTVATPAPPAPTNGSPVITGPANQSHTTGTSVSVQIVATDPEGSTLQYGASGLPAGVGVNTSTGVMSGTITAGAGTYTVTTTASDGAATATRTFTWTVTAASSSSGTSTTSGVVVRDTFTGANGTPLTSHALDVSPSSIWLQREGATANLMNGRGAEVASNSGYGLATVQSGASDGSVTVDMLSNGGAPFAGIVFRVVDANRLLLLRYAGNWSTGYLGLFRRVNGAFELIHQVTVSPATPGTTHRLGVQLTGDQVQAMWDGSVVFTRTVSDYQTATHHGLAWHSDDPYAYFDNFVVTGSGTVSTPPPPTVNAPPVITGPANQSNTTGSDVSVSIVASDPEGTSLQYGASGLPAGVSVNTSTGVMSGTLTASAGTYTVATTASDGTSTATRSFTWTVTAPSSPAPSPSPSGVVVRDTFTGAGTPLSAHQPDVSATGATWTQLEGATAWIGNGRVAELMSNSGYGMAAVNAGASDGSVTVDMLSNSGTLFAGIVFRVVDANRGLLLRYTGNWTTGYIGLFRRVNGAFELIHQVSVSPAIPGTTHKLGVQLTGNQVQAMWDGSVVFTRTVNDYQTATQHGLLWHSEDPYAYFDNFTVTAP